jgi:translation initiation factor IF-2
LMRSCVQPESAKKAGGRKGGAAQPKKKSSNSRSGKGGRRDRRTNNEENAPAEIVELSEEAITPEELATKLNVPTASVIKSLFERGVMATLNQSLGTEHAKMACDALGVEYLENGSDPTRHAKQKRSFVPADPSTSSSVAPRDPVVTVMGHVDHGKTTLLDFLRRSKVAGSEDGGITQSIGAHTVSSSDGNVVFLDTPGHEAFSSMRARGTRVTDIVVLVVAADDGVRPQTIEAIGHAHAAEVPLIVAVNKIDREGADPMRTLSELSEHGVLVEELGGDALSVNISALKGNGVNDLLETIVLSAQLLELKAQVDVPAEGTVVESAMDTYKGPKATLLVQNGTLSTGDIVRVGMHHGRARALTNDTGASVDSAAPSHAVEMIGLNGVPSAGDEFSVYNHLNAAREACEEEEKRRGYSATSPTASQASLAGQSGAEREVINVIVKCCSSGSVEAVKSSLQGLPQGKVALRFLLASAGEVTSSDVTLAAASDAVIIAFDAPASSRVLADARERSVEVRQYSVIYSLLDDMQSAMLGLLPPVQEEEHIGDANVLAVFGSGKWRVAGCKVTSGRIDKGSLLRVGRHGEEVFAGKCTSLRRVKDDVNTVDEGFECGVGAREYTGWREGDKISAYEVTNRSPTLE